MIRELQVLDRELSKEKDVTVLRKDFTMFGHDFLRESASFLREVDRLAKREKSNRVTVITILRN
jgi:hypothetical protein